jgi:F-type H+-transporting ATPase subunit gamma
MKAIKRRRLTVKNIQQITKAMNLVATSKLQRARAHLANVAQPAMATFKIAYNTLNSDEAKEQLFVAPRKRVKSIAYVLITGNRGLCGSYNSSVCKELVRHVKQQKAQHTTNQAALPPDQRAELNTIIFPIGSRGRDYFRRRNFNVADISPTSDTVSFKEATDIAEEIMARFASGVVDEVYVVYTKFVSVLTQEPIIKPLLPINVDFLRRVLGENLAPTEDWENLGFFKRPDPTSEKGDGVRLEVEYEPGLEEVLAAVIPWYLSMYLCAAAASSSLCEQAARMTSMDSATNNAHDIIGKLTLMFNRQRQSIITQELTEIVSGANALQ